MPLTVILALSTALVGYLAIGFVLGRKNKRVSDLFPLTAGDQASVRNSREFSASTVATSISLATVILAFFELAPTYGIWLFWCVITTSAGLFFTRFTARRIWHKMTEYSHRPTLHEFLGTEYGSSAVYFIGATCTSLGFLGAFAVELTVGSRFLAGLITGMPSWSAVAILAVIGLIYTAYGGFRAVIVTDRIQMISIWLMLAALCAFYWYYASGHHGWSMSLAKIPETVKQFHWHDQLGAFLIGILVINVPTFVADMSVWQRIAASSQPETVYRGLLSSVISSAVSWSLFVIVACLAMMVIIPLDDINPLLTLINAMNIEPSILMAIVIFFIVLGLYGAMLSTASTQLVAVAHTLYEDIISRFRTQTVSQRVNSPRELILSRVILILSALMAMVLVMFLTQIGFSISDFVFAIYGTQLGLFTPIVAALYMRREKLRLMADWVALAIGVGFITGWISACFGKISGNADFIFLAPVVSFVSSSILFGLGHLVSRTPMGHD